MDVRRKLLMEEDTEATAVIAVSERDEELTPEKRLKKIDDIERKLNNTSLCERLYSSDKSERRKRIMKDIGVNGLVVGATLMTKYFFYDPMNAAKHEADLKEQEMSLRTINTETISTTCFNVVLECVDSLNSICDFNLNALSLTSDFCAWVKEYCEDLVTARCDAHEDYETNSVVSAMIILLILSAYSMYLCSRKFDYDEVVKTSQDELTEAAGVKLNHTDDFVVSESELRREIKMAQELYNNVGIFANKEKGKTNKIKNKTPESGGVDNGVFVFVTDEYFVGMNKSKEFK